MSENTAPKAPTLPAPVAAPSPAAPSSSTVPNVVVITKSTGPGCLVQGLWFVFIGWWLGGLATGLAWFLNVIIIGLPLGLMILNNIPKILALQNAETVTRTVTRDGVTTIVETALPQHPFWLRALFFLFIGWWWSGIWLAIGYVLCLTILLMPVGFQVFRLAPAMTTLRRY